MIFKVKRGGATDRLFQTLAVIPHVYNTGENEYSLSHSTLVMAMVTDYTLYTGIFISTRNVYETQGKPVGWAKVFFVPIFMHKSS